MEKEERLKQFFNTHPRPAICYSGGVDSVFLLYAAKKYAADAAAYLAVTPFQPRFEIDDAIRAAEETDTELRLIPLDTLSLPDISANTAERCYHCKKAILSAVIQAAADDGRSVTADGTNASDICENRPGMRALRELGVCSPLRECGFTKSDIRALSKDAGLFTWNKPSYSCLATRIPHGIGINAELLNRTEAAETALRELGFTDFRCRYLNGAARLEISKSEIERAFSMRDEIIQGIGQYYDSVLLDLKGR